MRRFLLALLLVALCATPALARFPHLFMGDQVAGVVSSTSIDSIALSGTTFTAPAQPDTPVGNITVSTTPSGNFTCGVGGATCTLTGTDAASFHIVGSSLQTQASGPLCPVGNCTYNINVVATQSGFINSPKTVAFVITGFGSSGGGGGTGGTQVLSDASGVAETTYPLSEMRAFKQGDILNFPQYLVNGTAVTTQANVTNRWPDGSVKLARMAAIVNKPANQSLNITIQNQASGNTTALAQAQMLAAGYNFDATITLDIGGTPVTRSARTMMTDGNCTAYYPGQISQLMVCTDNSLARIYDIGFDTVRPIRPIFEVAFWPTGNRVSVRFIEESTNIMFLQDLRYNAVWKLGQTSPVTVYSTAGANVYHGTARSLGGHESTFWINGAPQQQVNLNYDIAYLASTNIFPNYDPSVVISDATKQAYLNNYNAQPHDLGQIGEWNSNLSATAARPDIGPTTTWSAMWSYTGDWRNRTVGIGQAQLAAAGWQFSYREGSSGKFMDRAQTIPALGKTLSIYARPTLDFSAVSNPAPADAFGFFSSSPSPVSVGNPFVFGSEGANTAHMPDPFSVPYLLTGDPFFLQQMQYWAASDPLWYCVANGVYYCRNIGTAGAPLGDPSVYTRGDSWLTRDAMNGAGFSPDGSGDQSMFTSYVDDTLSGFEGRYNLTGTTYQNTTNWQFGLNVVRNGPPGIVYQSPLHLWHLNTGSGTGAECNLDGDAFGRGDSPWMLDYLITVLGRGKDLGFKTDALLGAVGSVLVGALTNASVNHFAFPQAYRIPGNVNGQQNTLASTWAQVVANWSTPPNCYTPNATTWTGLQDFPGADNYVAYSKAAVSMVKTLTNGPTAIANWNTQLTASGGNAALGFEGDVKWDFLPR